jgi:hypothetical protein
MLEVSTVFKREKALWALFERVERSERASRGAVGDERVEEP